MLQIGWGHDGTGKGFSLFIKLLGCFLLCTSVLVSIIWKTEIKHKKEKQQCFFFFFPFCLSEVKVICHVPTSPSQLEVFSVLCGSLPEEGGNIYSGAELNLWTNETPAVNSVLSSCVLVVGYYCQISCNLKCPLCRCAPFIFEACNICKKLIKFLC